MNHRTVSLRTRTKSLLPSILYRNPIYHQVVFGAIVLGSAIRIAYLLKWSEIRTKIPDEKKAQIANIYTMGAAIFVLGFLVWNLDNIFCDLLTVWKTSLGWPAAFLLEGTCYAIILPSV